MPDVVEVYWDYLGRNYTIWRDGEITNVTQVAVSDAKFLVDKLLVTFFPPPRDIKAYVKGELVMSDASDLSVPINFNPFHMLQFYRLDTRAPVYSAKLVKLAVIDRKPHITAEGISETP